jgi:excisionase family DNA binding protein
MSETLLLSVADVAEQLSTSRTRVFALIGSGDLESVKLGRRRLVPQQALSDLVCRLRGLEVGDAG